MAPQLPVHLRTGKGIDMHFKSALLVGFIGFSMTVHSKIPASRIGAVRVATCNAGLAGADTARFVGLMARDPWEVETGPRRPPGSLRLWSGRDGGLHYSESWAFDTLTYIWDGDIEFSDDGLLGSVGARRSENGVVGTTEQVERVGDSVVVVRNGQRTAVRLDRDVFHVPALSSAPLIAALVQCAVSRAERGFRSDALGFVRVRELTTITLTSGTHSQPATLYLLGSDSYPQLGAVWLQSQSRRLIAIRGAEGVMDLVSEGWEGSLDQLVRAEVQASKPVAGPETCAGGVGPGGCEPTVVLSEVCRKLQFTPARFTGALSFSDSGYSVKSDGLGPYRSGSANVQVLTGPGASLLLQGTSPGTSRSFTIDLNRPVRGDIGSPLGTVKVDGVWPGTFVPAGAHYLLELAAFYINNDTTSNGISVGTTAQVSGIGFTFYLNGLAHVLQTGPFPWGGCLADGTAIYGKGTTAGTISRPTATTWIVDLPPGSVGRLFDNHDGDRNAVNRGLYYVSLHFVIQE